MSTGLGWKETNSANLCFRNIVLEVFKVYKVWSTSSDLKEYGKFQVIFELPPIIRVETGRPHNHTPWPQGMVMGCENIVIFVMTARYRMSMSSTKSEHAQHVICECEGTGRTT